MRNFLLRYFSLVLVVLLISSCSNNPHPDEDPKSDTTIYYSSYISPPKDYDPAVCYVSTDLAFLKHCYESLLDYDYLNRPLELKPLLAKNVPMARPIVGKNGERLGTSYRFTIHSGITYADDLCFPGGKGREVTVDDFVYSFKRAADPDVTCPIFDSLKHIEGFEEYSQKLKKLRSQLPELASFDLYKRAGDLPGVKVRGKYTFDLVLKDEYPQILYWLAMRFISAVPHEAVDFYDGKRDLGDEPNTFNKHPVGTGPYKINWEMHNPEFQIVFDKNEKWWGYKNPEASPGLSSFPQKPGAASDLETLAWTKEDAGRKLGQIDRAVMLKEKESLPRFSKFIQGYYDSSTIPVEKMHELLVGDELSPTMKEQGIRLEKELCMDLRYLGFNMQDDTIGAPIKFADPKLEANRAVELERRKKIRQAMALAIDYESYLRTFRKGSAINAQTIIPPAISGYDENYTHPYKQYEPNLARAKQLLEEAGYGNGIDPQTKQHLELHFIVGNTTPELRQEMEFFTKCWRHIGIDVNLETCEFNKFYDKATAGNFHLFFWGWGADYPDPENFLFLLYGKNSNRLNAQAPNYSRFENSRYDKLFKAMETMTDGSSINWTKNGKTVRRSRESIVVEMRDMLAEECPVIPLYHNKKFIMYHSWITNIKPHPQSEFEFEFYKIDKDKRTALREKWNKPLIWPAYVFVGVLLIFFIPAVITIRKERR